MGGISSLANRKWEEVRLADSWFRDGAGASSVVSECIDEIDGSIKRNDVTNDGKWGSSKSESKPSVIELMSPLLLFFLGLVSVGIVLSLWHSPARGRRLLGGLISLLAALACGFGYLASFELAEEARQPWLWGYGLGGLTFLAAAVLLWFGSFKRSLPGEQ